MVSLTDSGWGPPLVLAVITVVVAPTWLAWWNSRISRRSAAEAARQTQPNGGKSMRDVLDRLEAAQKSFQHEMREDVSEVKADIREVKADVRDGHQRIAALESRDPARRDRKGDR